METPLVDNVLNARQADAVSTIIQILVLHIYLYLI